MEFLKKLVPTTQGERVQMIGIEEIKPNPNQPRKLFHLQELESLSSSIRELGVLQPLTVRKQENEWELIAGERRLRASEMAGLSHVPCLVLQVPEQTSSVLALVENIQRENLDYLEEAHAIAQLISRFGLSQDEVSKQLGKSQSAVANMLRLLRLSDPVVGLLREGGCTQRHARALLKLPSEQLQIEVLQKVLAQNLNVAQTEDLIERTITPLEPKFKGKKQTIIRDVRLFLNTVNKSLDLMRTAGVDAEYEREENEEEILLTIRIPRKVPAKA